MYHIANTIQRTAVYEALSATSREFSNRISFGYLDTSTSPYSFVRQHTVCELKGCSIEQNACPSDKLTMGGAVSSTLSAEFTARETSNYPINQKTTSSANFITEYSYKDKIAFVECGIKYQGTNASYFLYIPMGYYVITEAESENDWQTVKIRGCDYMATLLDDKNNTFNLERNSSNDCVYTGSNSLPERCLCKRIATANGLDFYYNSDSFARYWYKSGSSFFTRNITDDDYTALQGLTWREALNRLSGLIGCTARFNTVGKLTLNFYGFDGNDYKVNIPATMQYQDGFKKLADDVMHISSITSNDNVGSDETYTAGSGTGISFANDIITHTDIDGIMTAITAYSALGDAETGEYKVDEYLPCEIYWRGNPCVEAGDIVTATYKGNTYNVLIAKQVIDLVGGLSMRITCPPIAEDINYDTSDWATERELARSITDVREALIEATAAINGSEGGYIQINDTNNDGNPDEILITTVEGGATGNVIKMNQAGIALGTGGINGTFNVAITGTGINASVINSGVINADLIQSGYLNGERIAAGSISAAQLNLGGEAETTDITIDNSKWIYPYTGIYGSDNVVARRADGKGFDLIDGTADAWADTKGGIVELTADKKYIFALYAECEPIDTTQDYYIQIKGYKSGNETETVVNGRLDVTTLLSHGSAISEIDFKIRGYDEAVAKFEATTNGYLYLTIDFVNCGGLLYSHANTFVEDFEITEYTAGEMIATGEIKSIISDSFLKLDDSLLSLTSKLFNTSIYANAIQTPKRNASGFEGGYALITEGGAEITPYQSGNYEYRGVAITSFGYASGLGAPILFCGDVAPTNACYSFFRDAETGNAVEHESYCYGMINDGGLILNVPLITNCEGLLSTAIEGKKVSGYAQVHFGDSGARTMINGNGAEVTTSIDFDDDVSVNGDFSHTNGNAVIGDTYHSTNITGKELLLDFYRTDSAVHGTLWLSSAGKLMLTVNGTQHEIQMT